MSIVTVAELLDFMELEGKSSFEVTAENNKLVLTSDKGSATLSITQSSYTGAELATAIQSAMNGSATLTGTGPTAASFTVAYSSTTEKFTLTASATHTIAYTHTGSSLGIDIGFDADHAAALSITSDNAVAGVIDTVVEQLRDFLESWLQQVRISRTLEETAYTKEAYDGNGRPWLYLNQFPVSIVERVAIGRIDGIRVRHTDTTATNALVRVTSTGVILKSTGGTTPATHTLLFASYATLTLLAAAIEALADWEATVIDSRYSAVVSTELLEKPGCYCGSRANASGNYAYLQIPSEPIDHYDVRESTGKLMYEYGFPPGNKNIIVDYTAGYSTAAMPEYIKKAVMMAVQYLYGLWEEGEFGLSSLTISGIGSKAFEDILPKLVLQAFDSLRKPMVARGPR